MRMNMNGSYSDTISIINDKEHLFSNYMRFKIQLLKLHFHSHDQNDDLPSSGLWINLRSSNLLVLSARDDDARRRATTQIALWGIGRRWPVRWITCPGSRHGGGLSAECLTHHSKSVRRIMSGQHHTLKHIWGTYEKIYINMSWSVSGILTGVQKMIFYFSFFWASKKDQRAFTRAPYISPQIDWDHILHCYKAPLLFIS